MSSRAELIGKLEAMRADVRSVVGESPEGALPTLTRAVDALTFVVIGMLEADAPCGNQDVTGRTCVRKTNHEDHHRSGDGWIW